MESYRHYVSGLFVHRDQAEKAKKEEVHVDVNVVNKEDKPVEPENKPE